MEDMRYLEGIRARMKREISSCSTSALSIILSLSTFTIPWNAPFILD
jgi:hypothetical protein